MLRHCMEDMFYPRFTDRKENCNGIPINPIFMRLTCPSG